MKQASLAESSLEKLCEFAVLYILAMQAAGLVNVAMGGALFGRAEALLAPAAVLAVWIAFSRPRVPIGALKNLPVRLPVAILAGTYALFLADALFSYPNGYDAVAYHLLKPLTWLQPPPVPLTEQVWQMALPANAELFTVPAVALNAQSLVIWGNVVATAILALGAYILGRRLSGSREGGVFSAAILLSVPIVVFQCFTVHVDAFGTAFVLAAAALFLRFEDTGRAKPFFLSALCAGVSIGTKQTFLLYAGVLLPFAIAALWKRKRRGWIVPLLLALAAPSALWIAFDWVNSGNPFFPVPVRVGRVSFPGSADLTVLPVTPSLTYTVTRVAKGTPVSEFNGVGAAFATFATAGLLAVLFEAVRARRLKLWALLAVFASVGGFWWIEIHLVRFGLPVVAAVAVFCSLLCTRLSGRQLVVAKALLTLGVAFTCLACLTVPANRWWNRIRTHDWSRAAYYGYPKLLDDLPPGTRVLDRSVAGHYGFTLAGRALTNRVFNLANSIPPAQLLKAPFEVAVEVGRRNAEDRALSECCELIYSGKTVTIFPKAAEDWRIYRRR